MELKIAKWGNSLAVRIPAAVARSIGVKAGDSLQVSLTADGGLSIHPREWSRKAFAFELGEARQSMPVSQSVMDELRRSGRYTCIVNEHMA